MLQVLLLSLSAFIAEVEIYVGHHLPGLSASDAEGVAISCVFLGVVLTILMFFNTIMDNV